MSNQPGFGGFSQKELEAIQRNFMMQVQKQRQNPFPGQIPQPGAQIPARRIRRPTGYHFQIGMSDFHRRLQEKRQNLRAADGALVGYRYWRLASHDEENNRGYFLMSPSQLTIWYGPTLEAHEFCESHMCEGAAGVHAKLKRDSSTNIYHRYGPAYAEYIWGRVRGYGNFVLGTEGWRAQRVMVDKLWLPSLIKLTNGNIVIPNLMKTWGIDLAERLATRYECRVVRPLEKKVVPIEFGSGIMEDI